MENLIERLKSDVEHGDKRKEDFDSTSWNYEEGCLISLNEAKEIIRLYEWRQAALQLFKDMNLQEIGKEMGLKPGEDICKKILPYIKSLK